MSPSEPKPGPPASGSNSPWQEIWVAGKEFPAGVPDPAVLARMANEFFTALPEFSQLSGTAPAAQPKPPTIPANAESRVSPQGLAGIAPSSAFPTEAELRALPASLPGYSTPPLPPFAELAPSLTTIPGILGAIPFSDIPTFSFLEDARPIFTNTAASAAAPTQSISRAQDSPERELRTATATLPAEGDLAGFKSLAAPQIPSARVRP